MKKTTSAKLAPEAQTPVFPKMLHLLRPRLSATTLEPKPHKRDDIFSKSRDTREDRGERQMKTSHNSRTFPHGK